MLYFNAGNAAQDPSNAVPKADQPAVTGTTTLTTPLNTTSATEPPAESLTPPIKPAIDPSPANAAQDPNNAIQTSVTGPSPTIIAEPAVDQTINPNEANPLLQDALNGVSDSVVTTDLSAVAKESEQALQAAFHTAEAGWEIGHDIPTVPAVVPAAASAVKLATQNSVTRSKFAFLTIGAGLIVAAMYYADKKARQRMDQRAAEIIRINTANNANPPPNPLQEVPLPLEPISLMPRPLKILGSMINKFRELPPKMAIPLLSILGAGSLVGSYLKRRSILPGIQAMVSMATENALLGKALIPTSFLISYGNIFLKVVEDLESDLSTTFPFVQNRVKPTLKAIVNKITPMRVKTAGAVIKSAATHALNWHLVTNTALWALAIYGQQHKAWVARNKTWLVNLITFIPSFANKHPVLTGGALVTGLLAWQVKKTRADLAERRRPPLGPAIAPTSTLTTAGLPHSSSATSSSCLSSHSSTTSTTISITSSSSSSSSSATASSSPSSHVVSPPPQTRPASLPASSRRGRQGCLRNPLGMPQFAQNLRQRVGNWLR